MRYGETKKRLNRRNSADFVDAEAKDFLRGTGKLQGVTGEFWQLSGNRLTVVSVDFLHALQRNGLVRSLLDGI